MNLLRPAYMTLDIWVHLLLRDSVISFVDQPSAMNIFKHLPHLGLAND